MAVTEETEAQVREMRAKAVEYGERVFAGEEPWTEANDGDEEAGDVAGFEETPEEPLDDDVGETGEPGGEVVENPQPIEPEGE